MKIKLWYLCNKETGKPIKLDLLLSDSELVEVPGACTKKALIEAANGIDKEVEDVRKIEIDV